MEQQIRIFQFFQRRPESLHQMVGQDMVAISAATGFGMDKLKAAIEAMLVDALHHVVVLLPYSMGGQVEKLHNNAQVKNVEYTAEGIEIEAVMDDILYGRLRQYVILEK